MLNYRSVNIPAAQPPAQKKQVCAVCHQEYGDFAAHNYIENAETDYLKTAATAEAKLFITRAVLYAEPKAKKPLKQVNTIT